jgi:hypothetical protein
MAERGPAAPNKSDIIGSASIKMSRTVSISREMPALRRAVRAEVQDAGRDLAAPADGSPAGLPQKCNTSLLCQFRTMVNVDLGGEHAGPFRRIKQEHAPLWKQESPKVESQVELAARDGWSVPRKLAVIVILNLACWAIVVTLGWNIAALM